MLRDAPPAGVRSLDAADRPVAECLRDEILAAVPGELAEFMFRISVLEQARAAGLLEQ